MHFFYIETEMFLTKMFEEILKENGHSLFSTDEEDCLYLIEDQSPDMVLIGLDHDENKIENLLKSKKNYNIVGVGTKDQINKFKEKEIKLKGFLQKPFVPARIMSELLKIL